MPSYEYWDGDADLVKGYRVAHRLRLKENNFQAWLQGLYIYNSLHLSGIPVIQLKKSKTEPYFKEPYDFFSTKEEQEVKEEKKVISGRQYMEIMMANINEKFGKESK